MKRLQRLRRTEQLRDMMSEVSFNIAQLIQPIFVVEGISKNESIPGLYGTERLSVDNSTRQIEQDLKNGVKNFILFLVPKEKKHYGISTDFGTEVVGKIKKEFGTQISLWADTCLCSFTVNGHCSICDPDGAPILDDTLDELSKLALSYAQAGCDGIAPSDMNDGRVQMIRRTLDENGQDLTPIMSYSTKFASSLYGPFRLAADSAPKYGNRRHYQLDVRNRSDAIASSVRCAEEGADLLMVKPAMTSLDLIAPITERTELPVGAYQVSGEYAGMVLLSQNNLLNLQAGLLESWHVLRRAGARFVITYGARFAAEYGLN